MSSWFVDACTSPDDRVLPIGFLPEFPFLAQRRFAGGNPTRRPGYHDVPRDRERIVERLRTSAPRAVVVERADRDEVDDSWPEVARLVERQLAPEDVPAATRRVDVWLARACPASGSAL